MNHDSEEVDMVRGSKQKKRQLLFSYLYCICILLACYAVVSYFRGDLSFKSLRLWNRMSFRTLIDCALYQD